MKKLFMGGILLVVGVLFLLRNFNVLPNLTWDAVWPWVSVIIGLKFLLCCGKKCGSEEGEKKEAAMKEGECCGSGACK